MTGTRIPEKKPPQPKPPQTGTGFPSQFTNLKQAILANSSPLRQTSVPLPKPGSTQPSSVDLRTSIHLDPTMGVKVEPAATDAAEVEKIFTAADNAQDFPVGTGNAKQENTVKIAFAVGMVALAGVCIATGHWYVVLSIGLSAAKMGVTAYEKHSGENKALRYSVYVLSALSVVGFAGFHLWNAGEAFFGSGLENGPSRSPIVGALLFILGATHFMYTCYKIGSESLKVRRDTDFQEDRKTIKDIILTTGLSGMAKSSTLVYVLYRTYYTFFQSPGGTPALFEEGYGVAGLALGLLIGKYLHGRGKLREGYLFSGKSLVLAAVLGTIGRAYFTCTTLMPSAEVGVGNVWDMLPNGFSLPLMLFVYWGETLHAAVHSFGYHDIQLNTLRHDLKHLPRVSSEEKDRICSNEGPKVIIERPTVSPFTWPVAHICTALQERSGNRKQTLLELGRYSPYEPGSDQNATILKVDDYHDLVTEDLAVFYNFVRERYLHNFRARAATLSPLEAHREYITMLRELANLYDHLAGGRGVEGPRGVVQRYQEEFRQGYPAAKEKDLGWSEYEEQYCLDLARTATDIRTDAAMLEDILGRYEADGQTELLGHCTLETLYCNLLNQFETNQDGRPKQAYYLIVPKKYRSYEKVQSKEPMQMKGKEMIGLANYEITFAGEDGEFCEIIPARLCYRSNPAWDHVEEKTAYAETYAEAGEAMAKDHSISGCWTPIEQDAKLLDRAIKTSRYVPRDSDTEEHKPFLFMLNDRAGAPIGVELKDGSVVYFPGREQAVRSLYPGKKKYISLKQYNSNAKTTEKILQVSTLDRSKPLQFTPQGEVCTEGKSCVTNPVFQRTQTIVLDTKVRHEDMSAIEFNLDEEHTGCGLVREGASQLTEATRHKKLGLRFSEKVPMVCHYENPDFPAPEEIEDAAIRWAHFDITYRTDGKKFDVPFGIEKFFLDHWNEVTTAGGKKPKLVPTGKIRVGRDDRDRATFEVECESKRRGEEGQTEWIMFYEEGQVGVPAYPPCLPPPEQLDQDSVKIRIYPKRVGKLAYLRYAYWADTLNDVPADLRAGHDGGTYTKRERPNGTVYYEYYRYARIENWDKNPFPWIDERSVDLSAGFKIKGIPGKKGGRVVLTAYNFYGKTFDWNAGFVDPGPMNAPTHEAVELVDPKAEGNGNSTVLCLRGENADGSVVRVDGQPVLETVGIPKAPVKGNLIECRLEGDQLTYVGHRDTVYATSPEMIENIPLGKMQWVDFIHIFEGGRIRVYFHNKKDNLAWFEEFTVSDLINLRQSDLYQDSLVAEKQHRLEELYTDLNQTTSPRHLTDQELAEVAALRRDLSEYHPKLETHEKKCVPEGGDHRKDFRPVKRPYLKLTKKGKTASVAAPARVVELARRVPRLRISSVEAKSAVRVREKETGHEIVVPLTEKIPAKHLVVTDKFFEGKYERRLERRPEVVEALRADTVPQLLDGNVLMQVFPQHIKGQKKHTLSEREHPGAATGEAEQTTFYNPDPSDGDYAGPKLTPYARAMKGSGGGIQAGSLFHEVVINSGTPVGRVVDMMFKSILEKENVDHPGGTNFIAYPNPDDITEDFKESRMIYMTKGYVALYSTKIVAKADGVTTVQLFVQRRRWSSSVAIGKIWIRPFLWRQVKAKAVAAIGLRTRTAPIYTWHQILYELNRCTWYFCGPANVSRQISPFAYQYFGMNPFMAEDEYFPYVWGTNFLSGYFAFIHSKQKAGRTTWESFGQEPAIFNVMTPMYCEMLFNIMDEHKGPFAATTLGGGRVQARYLRWAMYMTVLNIMAGTRGLSKMGDMYADRAGDFHEFGNTMNTVWPIWNAAFTLYGLQMAYKAQMVEQRDQMVAVEKMMLEERDQLSSGELSRIDKIIAVGRILECTK